MGRLTQTLTKHKMITDEILHKLEANRDKLTQIYLDDKEENTIPDVPCYVYCNGGIGEDGFDETEIDQYDLGINLLIAESWITKVDFNKL